MESLGNVFLIVMMMVCLIVFAIDINRHVSRLALNPLGRVLTVVQYHCEKIFQYTEGLVEELHDQKHRKEQYDNKDKVNEGNLLENIVDKLIMIVERAVQKLEPDFKVPTNDEERMILAFQDAGQIESFDIVKTLTTAVAAAGEVVFGAVKTNAAGPELQRQDSMEVKALVSKFVASDGVPVDVLAMLDAPWTSPWNFNALDVAEGSTCAVAHCIMHSTKGAADFISAEVSREQLEHFLAAVKHGY